MPRCLFALGSNSGDRAWHLEESLRRLALHPQIRLEKRSNWRETTPIGGPPLQKPYLNGAAIAETSLAPQDFLQALNEVEHQLGRRRGRRWDSRTIDLDLLLYEELSLSTPTLTLPHPRMAWRRFVLEPAAEIAGEMRHSETGWTIKQLLDHLDNSLPYVALSGPIGAGKTLLAEQLCRKIPARFLPETLDESTLETFYADPAAHAWAMEIEFLETRHRLLFSSPNDKNQWTEKQLAVSDFWFDQSLAFARVWLTPDKFAEFERRFEELRREVARPKLLVLLDAPVDALLKRIRRRARRGEESLTLERLEQIRQSILHQAALPDVGPVLRLDSRTAEESLIEAVAAIEAME
jgi:2-amino-4-hydroxy-6-hydroxymethyldihydropteridine diphosphokinase